MNPRRLKQSASIPMSLRTFVTADRPIGRSQLSHVHLFALGWTFYLALPMWLAWSGRLDDVTGAGPYVDYFAATSAWWPALLAYVAALPFVYLAGSTTTRLVRLPRLPAIGSGWLSPCLVVIYAILLVAYTLRARELLFTGYIEGVDSSLVGPIATLQILLLFEWLVCKAEGRRRLVAAFSVLLVLCSSILLGMGGRLYVVTTLVAWYFYWWKWSARSTSARRRSLAIAATIVFAMVLGGMYRLGEIDLSQLTFYFLAEPMYTGISGLSLVLNGSWSLLDAPRDFYSGFINLIPAEIWPGKSEYVTSLLTSGLDLESPFGALSIIASTIGNFGYLGGLAFIAFVGLVLGWSSRQTATPAGRALYVVLAALLPFMFFRDPFQIQIKVVLTCFLLLIIHALARRAGSKRRPFGARRRSAPGALPTNPEASA